MSFGITTLSAEDVRQNRGPAEAAALHETSFFRDREMFAALREAVLPRLIAENCEVRRLRVLCAGVAMGQEAYSVAMLLHEHFADALAGWDVKIVGLDRSSQAIGYARRGRYRRAEVNRGLPAKILVKYFGRDDEEWEIVPELGAMCEFREGDVCTAIDGTERFDLVLMRNVMLFLSEQERVAAFANVHRQMGRDGVLVLGLAEQAEDSTDLFEAEYIRGAFFYRPVNKG